MCYRGLKYSWSLSYSRNFLVLYLKLYVLSFGPSFSYARIKLDKYAVALEIRN